MLGALATEHSDVKLGLAQTDAMRELILFIVTLVGSLASCICMGKNTLVKYDYSVFQVLLTCITACFATALIIQIVLLKNSKYGM